MAYNYSGFGKQSGPSVPTKSLPTFGNLTPPPPSSTSPFPNFTPSPSPRQPEVIERTTSPSVPFGSSGPTARPYQTSRERRPEAPQKVLSPPSAFENPHLVAVPSFSSAGVRRSIEPPRRLDDGQRYFFKDYDASSHPRPSAVTSVVASRNSGTSATAKIARFQDLKRTRSPPLLSGDEEFSRKSSQPMVSSHSDLFVDDHSPLAPVRTVSPSAFQSNHYVDAFHPSFDEGQQPLLSSPMGGDHAKLLGNYPNLVAHQGQSRASPNIGSYDSERSYLEQVPNVQVPKRTKSPHVPSANGLSWENPRFALNDSKRFNGFHSSPDSQVSQRSVPSANSTGVVTTRSTSSPISKRTRSPPHSSDEGLQGNLNSSQHDTEREMQAKAKRLARFKVELSEDVQTSPDVSNQRVSTNRREQSAVERQKVVGAPLESAKDYPNDNSLSEYEGLETSSIIIGLCPDMCPESERAERERKGDLDRYERFDGDRNQTSKSLAVKKYNRTAEREANLIRPMPILQTTVGYLLDLLDQPYDERFLGLYNFLWDRMRAIRMDLRMQHIFNQEAITMLEQMIRLHIMAMHELCEYTKGEGFAEGFDAHLNIEQMNKTSVELFQMYDDHRKKGINVPTEKEFRGYYALLKLDKHPGYKVEPAELSLDLAKMTPEIRQTPEVLFARDVARACRMGNFIAFFRLARKASYLQACLMHAHFAKLRTQALASLHSGLLNNQGLPVAHVGRWLGMEEEDIESLLEYHGFLIKEFEELYMVKEGQFLNSDSDYPTKCSKLVHTKRSKTMVEDILASTQAISLPIEAKKEIQLDKIHKHDTTSIPSVRRKISVRAVDEEMSDSAAISSPKKGRPVPPLIETSMVGRQNQDDHKVTTACTLPWSFSVAHTSPKPQPAEVVPEEKQDDAFFRMSPENRTAFFTDVFPIQSVPRTSQQDRSLSFRRYDYSVDNTLPQIVATNNLEDEEPSVTHREKENDEVMISEKDEAMENEKDEVMASYLEEEVALAKLKLILRLWRRRSSKQKELREQRKLAANAALNSLSLGPPIQKNKVQPFTRGEFDIDHVMMERYEKHERSWSKLNVSDVIAGILGRRNRDAKFLCWKIILCSQDSQERDEHMQRTQVSHFAAESWLFSKLMPPRKDYDDDLVVSSPGLSIWKKWLPSQSGSGLTCCFSIVKETKVDHPNDTVSGASAVLFLVSESIPLKLQKFQLHNLLMSIPSGSCLPLLILSSSNNEEVLDPYAVIVNGLGLRDIDKSRVKSFMVKFLVGNQQKGYSDGFFSDEQLREGLEWLADQSPVQPVVRCVKTRELILTHLGSVLEVLNKLSDHEVSPNHCISAFNEALDRSREEIVAAAKANPASWPCPEIAMVDNSGDEYFMENWSVPSLGWSSATRIELLECSLKNVKLPAFPDDISWLSRGSNMGKEIEIQRSQLESCLIRYLTQSCNMMGISLATKEASIMLQRSTRLELQNLSYYMVPNWVVIFRRIFNWRLMSLTNGALSSAYVLEEHFAASASASDNLDKLGFEGTLSPPYSLSHLSLDEVLEGGFSPLLTQRTHSQPEVQRHLPGVALNGEVQEPANIINLEEDERNSSQNDKYVAADDVSDTSKLNNTASKIMLSKNVTRETENLSNLFERCYLLQNTNDKKLSVFF
ncbi:SAC3 family protein B isoform X1 [Pistacia vera]|uniref:SAC3 family protein B isoform X1 n=1 Tax=Pistacia vera TaxID=55513 RepID=UPI001263BCCA|nr:SAC3 family protein B isoform X1 [Pistacia vera]